MPRRHPAYRPKNIEPAISAPTLTKPEFGEIKTVEEVAKILGVHRQTILRYIRRGELQAVKIGNRYRITAEAYRRFIYRNETHAEHTEIEPIRN